MKKLLTQPGNVYFILSVRTCSIPTFEARQIYESLRNKPQPLKVNSLPLRLCVSAVIYYI
jgi:hypothetical protein